MRNKRQSSRDYVISALLIATTNQAKFKEAAAVLQEDNLKILNLRDWPQIKLIEETGKTFAENAELKARGYFAQTGIPTIADDGGLMIDYLGGAPGLHSRRWLGWKMTDKELVNAVLEKMKGVPKEKRTARLGGFIVFYDGKHLLRAGNYVEGYIADKLLCPIQSGFPYRSLLIVPQFNFRRRSLETLKPKILKLL